MSMHRYFSHNGRIREAAEASLFPGQLGLLAGWGVFTTMRIAEGAVFAWERHWARMSRDARLLNVPMPPDRDAVEADLLELVAANGAADCTMRLVVVRNSGGLWEGPAAAAGTPAQPSDTIALTADSREWADGVRLGVQPHGRYAASDFTRVKSLSWAHNLRWFERAREQGLDEVILLNEFGRVSECTSANIFAVFGNEVATPPLDEGCLPGVTREILLEAIDVPGILLVERPLTLSDLDRAEEVCITSSTRGLLTVGEISGRALPGNTDVCRRLRDAFDLFATADIGRRKHALMTA